MATASGAGRVFWNLEPEAVFFEAAVQNGWLKWIFCGHDHLGDAGIAKQYVQRGATLITRKPDGAVDILMVPLTSVVSTRVRGKK